MLSDLTPLIGKTGEMTVMEVEKGAIKRYADAVGDPNPIYWDDEYAKDSRYGSIIAPPGFFGWPTHWSNNGPLYSTLKEELNDVISKMGFSRLLDGGIEFELFAPVRAGDTLVSISKIVNVYEQEGKTGKMIFAVTETTYMNQNGTLVATVRKTAIRR